MRRRVRATPEPRDGTLHPLTASEVLRRAGVVLPNGQTVEDDLLWVTCPACGHECCLSAATLRPASQAEDISSYACPADGTELLVTGHPAPAPLHIDGRHTFGHFCLQPQTPTGMRLGFAQPR